MELEGAVTTANIDALRKVPNDGSPSTSVRGSFKQQGHSHIVFVVFGLRFEILLHLWEQPMLPRLSHDSRQFCQDT